MASIVFVFLSDNTHFLRDNSSNVLSVSGLTEGLVFFVQRVICSYRVSNDFLEKCKK